MIDMLVRLYDLPDSSELYAKMEERDITIRRARAFERHTVAEFASLDIGAMDLSEFYEDLENSLTIPDPATASAAIQQRLPNHGN